MKNYFKTPTENIQLRTEHFPAFLQTALALLLSMFFFVMEAIDVNAQCALLNDNFSSNPVLAATNTDGAWYPDRYQPAAFTSDAGRLKISISAADGAQLRDPGYVSAFYNTQGRKFNQCGKCVTVAKADLYIPAAWANNFRRSDIWATAFDASNAISFYPIIGFRNVTGSNPQLSYWDGLGWVELGPPSTYDTWYTMEIRLNGVNLEYLINNSVVGTLPSNNSTYFGNIIMQAYNFNDSNLGISYDAGPNNSYDAFWDNLVTGGTGGNLVTNTNTGLTYCSIQSALNDPLTLNSHIITVAPGTYAENIIVNKSVEIRGPNYLIDPCSGTRVAEAIVVPAVSDIDGNAEYSIFDVQASNVKIVGLTIDGDNPSLTTGFTSTTTADIDIAVGITRYVTGNNMTVFNNIIKNVSYFAVELYDYPAGVPSAGNVVANNKIQDLGTYDVASGINFWGGGVLLYNNQYTAVTNNCMTNVRIGVQTGNFYQANPGTAASQIISGNTIQARRVGVFHNLHYGTASPMTLSENTITGLTNANETGVRGMLFGSLSVNSTASNNTINLSAVTSISTGYEVWNVKNTTPVLITGGTVSGVNTGVFLNNFEGYNSDGSDGAHASISGVSINASGTGIRLLDSPSSTTHANVQATVTNCFITGGTDGVKLEETVASKVAGTINNNSITGQSGKAINATTIANMVDATCNWYGTTNGATIATLISGSVTYIPYLVDGNDSAPATLGFQPAVGACTGCTAASVSFDIGGIPVAGNNNGSADPSESATVALCDGGTYTLANLIHSVGTTNRYIVSITISGGGLLFNGSPAVNGDIDATQFSGAQGPYIVTLSNPVVGGTVVQTITPYDDADNGGSFSTGDCIGDPITITYVAFPVNPTFSFTGNGDSSVGNDSVNVSLCTGGNLTLSTFATSSPSVQYHEVRTASPGLLYGASPISNATQNISAAAAPGYFGNTYGPYNNPTNAPGTIKQVITPYEDVNGNNQYDAGTDCAGTPVTLTITVNPQPRLVAHLNGVTVNSNNDGNTDTGSFAVCNNGTIAISTNFSDANGLTGAPVRIYQTVTTTNASVSFCNNCQALLSAFTAGTSTPVTLTNPALPGMVVITFQAWQDLNGNSMIDGNECTGDVIEYTVTISPFPTTLACPNSFSVNSSTDGIGNCSGTATWAHPTIATGTCGLVSLTMSIDGGTPVPVTSGGSATQTFSVGPHTVSYVATDIASNTANCSFAITVVDDESPAATCSNQTITFNGQSSIALNVNDLVSASDNCGIQSITISPTAVNCEQVGQVVPITATITDVNNNVSTCTSNITVGGLPCGWSSNSNSIGCNNNLIYTPGTGTYTNTAGSCFYGPPYTVDDVAFVQRTLCGDGSITALVNSINALGTGWAGVTMRESLAVGSKKAQLMTNLSNLSRREFRTANNAAAQPQQFPSQNRYWLRIVRAGNQFTMFVSPNGTTWYLAGAQNIVMANCIEIGLVTTNYTPNGTTTTVFSNVSFSGANTPLVLPGNSTPAELADFSSELEVDFSVFPNPTSGELNLDLTQYIGRNVRIETYSLEGKLLRFTELDEVQTTLERLDLTGFQSGMYLVKVKSVGLPEVARRVVKQ